VLQAHLLGNHAAVEVDRELARGHLDASRYEFLESSVRERDATRLEVEVVAERGRLGVRIFNLERLSCWIFLSHPVPISF
jgi:hypothetical protein